MPFNEVREPSQSTSYDRAILATVWTFTGISTATLCARLFIRLQRFRRLYWDDFFVITAWVFAVPLAAQATVSIQRPTTVIEAKGSIFTSRPLVQFFFYTSLWCIKVSFLLFFRRIGSATLRSVKIYWGVILGFTILSYFILWAINPYSCWAKKGLEGCAQDPSVQRLWPITYGLAIAFDILTDILIMAIPFAILAHVRLSMRQRLILYSLFSLVVLTMAVSIARGIISVKGFKSKNSLTVSLLLFLANIEASTAIFVTCIGSLRTLFTQEDRSRTPTVRRSRISPLVRGNIARSESTDAIISIDMQDLPSTSSKPSIRTDATKTPPRAHVQEEIADAGRIQPRVGT